MYVCGFGQIFYLSSNSRNSLIVIIRNSIAIYKLDTETKGSTGFRNPRALLRARGFLKPVDPIG